MKFGRLMMIALLAALAGCNMAVSEAPMFAEADRSDIRLRDGYWLPEVDDCQFDTGQPVERWPACGEWALIAGNRIIGEPNGEFSELDPVLFIASGEPLILQLLSKPAQTEKPFYHFAVFDPTATGPDGQVDAVALWIVQCGPRNPNPDRGPRVKPYPGLDADCRPSSVAALRAAAIASRPEPDEIIRLKWVRAAN